MCVCVCVCVRTERHTGFWVGDPKERDRNSRGGWKDIKSNLKEIGREGVD